MLFTATDARRIISSKEFLIGLILLTIVLAIGLAFAVYLYTLDKYSLLYYGDAVSHLVRAREFIDSANPGMFEQLGTAWLPLPHLLLLPFTLIDSLFITGFAGLVISLPSLAITSVLIYKMIKTHLGRGISYIAIAGALLYASNPNVLYMGMTAMTEAPFMLFFVASAYYFQRWTLESPKYIHFQSEVGGGGTKSQSTTHTLSGHSQASSLVRDLLLCSIFLSLATLCRYESWILPIFLILFVVLNKAKNKKQRYYYSTTYSIGIIIISILSFSGIAFWLAWNAYEYGDPLEFLKAPFFSAASQALEGPNRESLYLQPWNVVAIYTLTALAMYGPALLAAAVLGYFFHRYFSGKKEEKSKRKNLYIFLALPPLLTVFSMIIGIGEMNHQVWFNSRFLILVSPLIILLACVFITRLPYKIRKNHFILIAIIGILFVYQFATPELRMVITFLDAQYQFFSANRPFQLKTVEALSSIYDGSSRILIITGSA